MTLVRGLVSCEEIRAQGVSDRVTAITEVLPGVAYQRTKPAYLDTRACGDETSRQANINFAALSTRPVQIDAFELSRASVYGQGTVLTYDEKMVRDSAVEFLAHNLAPDGSKRQDNDAIVTDRDPEPDILPGRSLLLKRPWYRNFGHWLVDLMPLPAIVRNAGIHVDRAIIGDIRNPELLRIIKGSLADAFPDAELLIAADDRHVRCETLIYVTPVHVPPLFKHPLSIEATVSSARRIFANGSAVRKGRKIYLSRQNAPARRLVNGLDLEELLGQHQFESVFTESMSFDDQISLFSGADVIVGVKGAALTNAIFSPARAKMLVISPSRFIDPFFWDLVTPRGIEYSEIFCPADPEGPPSMLDFEVDLGSVAKYLE